MVDEVVKIINRHADDRIDKTLLNYPEASPIIMSAVEKVFSSRVDYIVDRIYREKINQAVKEVYERLMKDGELK
jgi:hypothetical protein